MPRITLERDNLDERNAEFVQAPLKQPVFLNSVPKAGTHLIRNIMRMFAPLEQHYSAEFIQIMNMQRHKSVAWSAEKPRLSWGHMLFNDEPAIWLKNVRHILLVRDPYDWVLARARFYLSENFDGQLENIKAGRAAVNDVLSMMIFGVHPKAPPMDDVFRFNALAWLSSDIYLMRYEELVAAVKKLDTAEAETYFFNLFAACGIDPPDDWRERVRIGSDRKQSSTARENLRPTGVELPDELPLLQRRLVDYACPGVRALLGYA